MNSIIEHNRWECFKVFSKGVAVHIFRIFLFLFLHVLLSEVGPTSLFQANAEPWLSTRFAQNCAGCHAPGRINLPPKKRMCSLSCQGCHVNPNGGGMRSFYGKWNENRLLRSWIIDSDETPIHKPGFAKRSRQIYGKNPFLKIPKKKREAKAFQNKILNEGLPLIPSPLIEMKDKNHDRVENPYTRTAESQVEFLYQVPQDDPYRLKFLSKFDGGGDFRWQFLDGEVKSENGANITKTDVHQKFLMSADFGLRYRPVYKKYHLVYESRFVGSTRKDTSLRDSFAASQTRSLYLMVDELPYNFFFMHGYYRPLFGNYTADHTLLSQKMFSSALGFDGGAYAMSPLETTSIGTAPNVPYGNVHIITGAMDSSWDKYEGTVANLGLRFVKFSASVNYTFWSSGANNDSIAKEDLETNMHSLHLGGKLGRFVLNLEYATMARSAVVAGNKAEDEGAVQFVDLNVQAWREFYGVLQYSSATSTPRLEEGSSTQFKVGMRAFLLPGIEWLLYLENEEVTTEAEGSSSKTSTNAITSQIHMFM